MGVVLYFFWTEKKQYFETWSFYVQKINRNNILLYNKKENEFKQWKVKKCVKKFEIKNPK